MFPAVIGAWAMYIFQSLFNLVVTSNSGQAALTMPIMAPLADLVGVSRQVAVLAISLVQVLWTLLHPYQPADWCASVARIEWAKWARFQIKMQGFLFVLGTIFIMIAIAIGLQ